MTSSLRASTTGSGGFIGTSDASGTLGVIADAGIVDASTAISAMNMPVGTTAQRPVSPTTGASRYNTTLAQYEVYNGTTWVTGFQNITASYLLVGGGGGGGGYNGGGGGGAGGMITGSTPLATNVNYVVTVGAGGTAGTNGVNAGVGGNSAITNLSVTSLGGGYGCSGGPTTNNGGPGGSGGGGSGNNNGTGGAGTYGQGNPGGTGINSTYYSGGGGGGAGGVGGTGTANSSGGTGGIGLANSITGTSTYYAGGGGGAFNNGAGAAGGSGGGGTGGGTSAAAVAGTTNSGGGGGGGSTATYPNGAAGGSGVAIVSYSGLQQFNSPVATYNYTGGYSVHTFPTSGTLTYSPTKLLYNSLRFRGYPTNAYLSKTFASLSTVKTQQTFSVWCKRAGLGTDYRCLFGAYDGTSTYAFQFQFSTDNTLQFEFGTSSLYGLYTTQVFRDPSAWYHIVLAIDTTQATASNRVKLYVNGSQVTSFSTANYPPQNATSQFPQSSASAWSNKIGSTFSTGGGNFYEGYLAEVNFIDGQALTPSSFGAYNVTTGVWQPVAYTGTYGLNGFYTPFNDNSSVTALGLDYSGNRNNWTPNNFSVTAGSTYDYMLDSPTLTSATASNFAVANPVDQYLCTITQGNLSVATNNGGYGGGVRSTIAVSSGKWYWESVITVLGGTAGQAPVVGIIPSTTPINAISSNTRYAYYGANGNKLSSAGSVAYGATFSTGDVIGYALDLDAGTLTFYKNNTSQGTAFTGLSGSFCVAVYDVSTGGTTVVNFGQQPFTYTPPSGYVRLNTYNLPTPAIVQPNKYFDINLYTGTGAALSQINASGFKLDLAWIKCRSAAQDHNLYDSVRGVNNYLTTDTGAAAVTVTQGLSSFATNGFSVGTGSDAAVNTLGQTYAAWQWQAGQGTTSTNTSGTITSTVSVNITAGFSIVAYGGTVASQTIGHGLGVAPSLIIVKSRTASSGWNVYSASLGATQYLSLNGSAGATTDTTYWNSTAPTSSVFTIGSAFPSGQNFIAYCWTPIAGYSAFGSYTGNGSTAGPFIYTGFQPRFILQKRTDTTSNWRIWDTARTPYNNMSSVMYPDVTDAEYTATTQNINVLSNGFSPQTTAVAINGSGGTYIYAAFAANPFKYSLAF